MQATKPRTYAAINGWRQYQRFLPARMRLTDDHLPAEEWWSLRNSEIHLDRYAAPDAPMTVVMLHGGGGNGRLMGPFGRLLRFLQSVLAIRPAIEPEDFDVCPVLLAHPAADRWTTIEASLPFFDRIKAAKELVMLANCGHFPIEEPGLSQFEAAAVAFLNTLVREAVAV